MPDAATARATWDAVEPLHALVYFAPETRAGYEAAGLTNPFAGYFASRAAAMGAVSAAAVTAAFNSFSPKLVASVLPDAWTEASPAAMVGARLRVADAALRRILGDHVCRSDAMAEAAALSRSAASACAPASGRPLAASQLDLDWPDSPHLALWHAQSILREYRGDGHVATLVTEGLDGLEAVVTHAAAGGTNRKFSLVVRGWTEEEWDAAVARLRARGIVEDDRTLTSDGATLRQRIEDRTDALATRPYAALGADGCARLRELVEPWREAVFASGAVRRPKT